MHDTDMHKNREQNVRTYTYVKIWKFSHQYDNSSVKKYFSDIFYNDSNYIIRADHVDLLVIEGSERMHYTYISNFSRLVRSQKISHRGRIFICKRCFISFDEHVKKNKLCGSEVFQKHMRLCGPNKPIISVMPEEGEVLKSSIRDIR